MIFTRLYADSNGESHFKEEEVTLAKNERGTLRSEVIKATGVSVMITSATHDQEWHNPSHRQFVITLEGRIEIIASDGTKRQFGPGDIMLADDTTGRGHISRAVNNQPRKALVVTLE